MYDDIIQKRFVAEEGVYHAEVWFQDAWVKVCTDCCEEDIDRVLEVLKWWKWNM